MLRALAMFASLAGLMAISASATPPPPVQPGLNFGPAANADVPALVEGNNQFAVELFRLLAQTPGNTFFSPYSISSALTQVYAGARGVTAQEIAQTLHFTVPDERLHAACGNVMHQLHGRGQARPYQLRTANCLWVQHGLTVRPEFLRLNQTYYQGSLGLLDFYRNPEGSRATINRWVENSTNNKIRELLRPGTIKTGTRTVLTNAIYFKADWHEPFPEHATRPDKFTIPGVPAFRVPMMNLSLTPVYFENDDFQMVELSYRGSAAIPLPPGRAASDAPVSMVVILPKKIDALARVERKLTARGLHEALSQAQPARVDVTLPKFKMTEEFELKNVLAALGIRAAFSDGADFSGLIANERYPLKIDAVIHKAFVEVEEKGTEAAAATAITMLFATAPPPGAQPPPPIPFRADHPFLFLIRHNATGSILFLGRVMDPRRT